MSYSHLIAGLFLVLGTADLALLNVWLVPAAWPPPSDPIATLTTPDPLERRPGVEETSAGGHAAALQSRDEVVFESADGTEPPKVAAVRSYAADAEVKLEKPIEVRSKPAGDPLAGSGGVAEPQPAVVVGSDLAGTEAELEEEGEGAAEQAGEPMAGPGGIAEPQPDVVVGPDLAGTEAELEEEGEGAAEQASEPLAEAAVLSAPVTTAALEPMLASRYSGKSAQPSIGPQYRIVHHAVIQFSFDKESPKSAASDILGQTLEFFREHPDAEIQVDGHTDSSGNEAYNYYLSERRARAIARELEAGGIPSGSIQVRGYGPSRPLDTRNIAWVRAQNRRVEITIRSRLP